MPFAVPEEIVNSFNLNAGEEVVEFGSGIGAYTLPCARIVGRSGKIYAVDVQKDLLERLRRDAKIVGIDNIEYIWGDVEILGGIKLKDHCADMVVMASVLFQLEDKEGALAEAKRLLRPGGKVILVDWSDSYGGLGPQQEDVLRPMQAEEIFLKAGFKKLKEFTAGDHHYGLIFQKVT